MEEELYGKFLDERDGETYEKVTVGNQVWMAENLRYAAAGSYKSPDAPVSYGRLYSWNILMNGEPASATNPSRVQGLCPDGWHIPSDAEWKILETEVGMDPSDVDDIGLRIYNGPPLKSDTGWNGNQNGTNGIGFNALPSGYYTNGLYREFSSATIFLTATDFNSLNVFSRKIGNYRIGDNVTANYVFRGFVSKNGAFSCRCVKD